LRQGSLDDGGSIAVAVAANGGEDTFDVTPAVNNTAMVHVYDRTGPSRAQVLVQVGEFLPQDDTDAVLEWTTFTFCIETLGLMITSVATACVMDSVLIIWTIAGSTVSFFIAFIFPILIWLRLHAPLASTFKVIAARLLLVLTVGLSLACTYEVATNLSHPTCPAPLGQLL
jgi:hypothetical protein